MRRKNDGRITKTHHYLLILNLNRSLVFKMYLLHYWALINFFVFNGYFWILDMHRIETYRTAPYKTYTRSIRQRRGSIFPLFGNISYHNLSYLFIRYSVRKINIIKKKIFIFARYVGSCYMRCWELHFQTIAKFECFFLRLSLKNIPYLRGADPFDWKPLERTLFRQTLFDRMALWPNLRLIGFGQLG